MKVDGMSCIHCENRVKKAVSALAGVKGVDVSLEEKTVTVDFDVNIVSAKQIETAIEDLGYTVIRRTI